MLDPQIHAQARSKPRLCVSLARDIGEVRMDLRVEHAVHSILVTMVCTINSARDAEITAK